MKEYGSEYEENDSKEIDGKRNEDTSKGKNLNEDKKFDNLLDNGQEPIQEKDGLFDEFKDWEPSQEKDDLVDEFKDWEPSQEKDDLIDEFKDWEPKTEVKEEFSTLSITEEIEYKNQPEINKEVIIYELLNGEFSNVQEFKDSLKENLYKNTRIDLSEKSKIFHLIQNEVLTEKEKDDLKSILSKFSTEELEEHLEIEPKNKSTFCEEIEESEEKSHGLEELTEDTEIKHNYKNLSERLNEETKCDISLRNKGLDLNGIKSEIRNFDVENSKDQIRNIDWDNITKDWEIEQRNNQYSANKIQLDPKQDCSRTNQLYKHKKWMETVYNNEELKLTDQKISEICGVHLVTIQNWRKIHNIPAKDWTVGRWVDERGYVKVLMPKGYLHPELVPNKGRNVRFEHVIVMEKHLSENPGLEWSKEYLIDGKYLKTGTIVHHINFKKSDNKLENLWLYENIESHKKVERTLNECFRDLIKLNQIGFGSGRYYLKTNFDCAKLSSLEIKETLKPISINPYKDIKLVKEEIKKINWEEVSDNWIVKIGKNQYSEKKLMLDPYSDCSVENPLYLHKNWVERLVNDENFNLTQRRLANLCEVDRGVIHYWSKIKHNLNMENEKRGFGKYRHSAGRVRVKVSEDYGNPIAKRNSGWMYEHRYILERYLAENLELDWSRKYLISRKYLKPKCVVHHINFDPLDNRLKNLWICENKKEHRKLESSLTSLVDDLIKSNYVTFINGKYKLNL